MTKPVINVVITLGENGTCPGTQRKPDNKICNNGSNVCKNGECKGSICSYYGLNQCPCNELGYLCQVCCNNTMVGSISNLENSRGFRTHL